MVQHFDETNVAEAAAQVSDLLANSQSAVAFTGAGISTESGIPDFRSPGGVWAKNQPVYFDDFMSSADARYEYWRQKAEAHRDFAVAAPNITHQTLADWEQNGRLRGVVTQNIDGLHQAAGSQNVLELHGTAREVACMDCDWREPADPWVQRFLDDDTVPECPACGEGRVKHATVSFGQSLPTEVLRTAANWSAHADLYFAMGSSLVVHPAAGLPQTAAENGAKLVILNRDETPLDWLASIVVRAPLGVFFRSLMKLEDE